MPAACLEQNALQNVSCRVIEFFSLQYHTHIESGFLLKALTVAMAFLNMAEVMTLKKHLLDLKALYRTKTLDFTRFAEHIYHKGIKTCFKTFT